MESQSVGIIGSIIYLVVIIFYIYCMWKLYEKAGRPGWESIVPIYGAYIMVTKIAKLEWWYLLLFFVPLVNIYAIFKVYIALAKNFGKSTMYGIALIFLSFILFPMLALGDAEFIPNKSLELEDNLVK